jgi:hypothetical protein
MLCLLILLQQWLQEHASLLLYTCIASLVLIPVEDGLRIHFPKLCVLHGKLDNEVEQESKKQTTDVVKQVEY